MYLNRIRGFIHAINQSDFQNVLVSDPASIAYLIGYQIDPGERLLLLNIRSNGQLSLYLNRLFPSFQTEHSELMDLIEVVTYEDGEPVIQLIGEQLTQGLVGIDKIWPSHFLLSLMEGLPDLQVANGSYLIDDLRAVKSDEEQTIMIEASRLNDLAMTQLIDKISLNLTEKEMVQQLAQIYTDLDCDDFSFEPIVAYGPNGADPHHVTSDDQPSKGNTVVLDIGSRWNGYCSDMTRTIFYGQPDKASLEIYQLVLAANEAAIAAVKPDVTFAEIDLAARQIIEAAGYGDYFTHRTGHFIGREVHEAGDVSQFNKEQAKVGQIFSIEPGIYLPGKLGVRIEDLVLVTKDGCQILNQVSKQPIIIEPMSGE